MGYQKIWLAWILMESNWNQALEEMNFCHSWVRITMQHQEMCSFLGSVNANQLIWPKWAHLLTPLSDELGKRPFVEPQKWKMHLKLWNKSKLQIPSWHTPTTTQYSAYTLMLPTTKWVLKSCNKNGLLHIGLLCPVVLNLDSPESFFVDTHASCLLVL